VCKREREREKERERKERGVGRTVGRCVYVCVGVCRCAFYGPTCSSGREVGKSECPSTQSGYSHDIVRYKPLRCIESG